MNNGFTVAAVTLALQDRLHAFVADAVPGARVTTLNPSSEALRGGDPIVNLYLFRTARNPYVSNDDLPTRAVAGKPLASPVLKLDLDYMISFFGDDTKLDPQRLLGLVVGGLNAEPYIPRDAVRNAIATTPWLGGAPEMPSEQIRVTPLSMLPDAMARLWSEFVNVPYQLTQLYTVTPVSLVTELAVEPVLPVRRIGLRAVPSRTIVILALVNADDPALPLVAGGTMGIRLANPGKSGGLTVQINGLPATGVKPGFDAEGFAVLLVHLTADQSALPAAGPLEVQVMRRGSNDGIIAESTVVRATMLPGLAAAPDIADGRIDVQLALAVLPEASISILLFPRGGGGRPALRLPCAPRKTPSATLAASLSGVAAGDYLVSVEVDGLATLLDFDKGVYSGPIVDVKAA